MQGISSAVLWHHAYVRTPCNASGSVTSICAIVFAMALFVSANANFAQVMKVIAA